MQRAAGRCEAVFGREPNWPWSGELKDLRSVGDTGFDRYIDENIGFMPVFDEGIPIRE